MVGVFLLRCGNPFGIMDLQKNKGDYFMSMQIVFEQILIIFGYVIVGYVAGKKNLITKPPDQDGVTILRKTRSPIFTTRKPTARAPLPGGVFHKPHKAASIF